ncbi:MAG: UDP-N-acetylmuramoyl-L-alanyl-D-glutamate--2,6-diaminopimelate ligase [bacterium]|nr:UDP-N-acetylmuramoyl-L-alanyl-D-glutamate--2,6-diaminopimelate ligase [bacterium]
MQLTEILDGLTWEHVSGTLEREVCGITLDSRLVKPGMLFVALRGALADGHKFVADAVERGAAAIAVTAPGSAFAPEITVVRLSACPATLAHLAQRMYGQPACALIGITGTNGKTTSTYMVRHFLAQHGRPTGIVGTIVYEFGARSIPAARTTPDIFQLYGTLAQMAGGGARAIAMEVSSHALEQERLGQLTFDVAAFTNLTQDHLDYHGTLDAYFAAKATLFDRLAPATRQACAYTSVIGIDDVWGQRLAAMLAQRGQAVATCSVTGADATFAARNVKVTASGSTFDLLVRGADRGPVQMNLLGRHNVANCLLALAIAHAFGVEIPALIAAAATLPATPGRLEFIPNELGITVIVDYAHSDDALRNVLECVREITPGALWVVFGCGGDRDRGKRPNMGAVAEQLADQVVITSDNPRSEEPAAIVREIQAGMQNGRATVLLERRAAIAHACRAAQPGDVIVIAGKGHETYQEVKRVFHAFDDRVVAREILAELEQARVH